MPATAATSEERKVDGVETPNELRMTTEGTHGVSAVTSENEPHAAYSTNRDSDDDNDNVFPRTSTSMCSRCELAVRKFMTFDFDEQWVRPETEVNWDALLSLCAPSTSSVGGADEDGQGSGDEENDDHAPHYDEGTPIDGASPSRDGDDDDAGSDPTQTAQAAVASSTLMNLASLPHELKRFLVIDCASQFECRAAAPANQSRLDEAVSDFLRRQAVFEQWKPYQQVSTGDVASAEVTPTAAEVLNTAEDPMHVRQPDASERAVTTAHVAAATPLTLPRRTHEMKSALEAQPRRFQPPPPRDEALYAMPSQPNRAHPEQQQMPQYQATHSPRLNGLYPVAPPPPPPPNFTGSADSGPLQYSPTEALRKIIEAVPPAFRRPPPPDPTGSAHSEPLQYSPMEALRNMIEAAPRALHRPPPPPPTLPSGLPQYTSASRHHGIKPTFTAPPPPPPTSGKAIAAFQPEALFALAPRAKGPALPASTAPPPPPPTPKNDLMRFVPVRGASQQQHGSSKALSAPPPLPLTPRFLPAGGAQAQSEASNNRTAAAAAGAPPPPPIYPLQPRAAAAAAGYRLVQPAKATYSAPTAPPPLPLVRRTSLTQSHASNRTNGANHHASVDPPLPSNSHIAGPPLRSHANAAGSHHNAAQRHHAAPPPPPVRGLYGAASPMTRPPPSHQAAYDPSRSHFRGRVPRDTTFVLDTCSLIDLPFEVIHELAAHRNRVIIPFIVIHEIDGLSKDQAKGKVGIARGLRDFIAENIEKIYVQRRSEQLEDWKWVRGATSPDDLVLGCALYFKEQRAADGTTPLVYLVTNDKMLQVKCRGENMNFADNEMLLTSPWA